MKACVNCDGDGCDCFDPKKNPALKREIQAAKKAMIPENYIHRIILFARNRGIRDIEFQDLRHRLGLGSLYVSVGTELKQHRARL